MNIHDCNAKKYLWREICYKQSHSTILSVSFLFMAMEFPRLHGADIRSKNSENLFHLSLSDLAHIPITVASKKEERIIDAPGIVSVITAEEIRRFGGRNLREVLNRATSFQAVSSEFAVGMSVYLRGQSLAPFDNHILYLINGKPFRDSTIGGRNSPLLRGFPVDIIERLEIIRGPGSVLYGSNALSGVVNIVTKNASDLRPYTLSGSYGSLDTKAGKAILAQSGDDWESVVAFRHFNSSGWRFRYSDPGRGGGIISSEYDTDEETTGAFALIRHKNLKLSGFYGADNVANFDFGESVIDTQRWNVNAEYTFNLGDKWQAEGNVTHNGLIIEIPGSVDQSANDLHTEFTLKGSIYDHVNILFGAVFEFHDGEVNTVDYDTKWYSAYSQVDYSPLDQLKLIGGLQWNKPTGVPENFSPRISAIFEIHQHWGLKLGYGEAFRAALGAEKFFRNTFVSGNPDLKPEIIKTAEAQVFYHNPNSFLGLSYFYSDLSGLIVFVPSTGPSLNEWVNFGEINSCGVELEGKTTLAKSLQLTGSVTYQTNEDQDGIDDVTLTPNWMAKFGISYDRGKGYTIGLFDTYFGQPTPVKDVNPNATDLNPKPDAYHLLTLNVELHIPTLIQKSSWPDTTLTVYADNLLDEEIHFSDFNSRRTRSIPQHSGRALYATLEVQF